MRDDLVDGPMQQPTITLDGSEGFDVSNKVAEDVVQVPLRRTGLATCRSIRMTGCLHKGGGVSVMFVVLGDLLSRGLLGVAAGV